MTKDMWPGHHSSGNADLTPSCRQGCHAAWQLLVFIAHGRHRGVTPRLHFHSSLCYQCILPDIQKKQVRDSSCATKGALEGKEVTGKGLSSWYGAPKVCAFEQISTGLKIIVSSSEAFYFSGTFSVFKGKGVWQMLGEFWHALGRQMFSALSLRIHIPLFLLMGADWKEKTSFTHWWSKCLIGIWRNVFIRFGPKCMVIFLFINVVRNLVMASFLTYEEAFSLLWV